jgi:hypothetical protein
MPEFIHRPLTPKLVLAICAGSVVLHGAVVRADSPVPAASNPAAPQAALPRELCPTDIPGTSIVAAPISDGAALLFFAPRDVGELRRRVHALAAIQNRGAITPPEAAPVTREPPSQAEPHEPIASVFDVHGGVMLKFTPSKVDQLADVQDRALEYAQRLAGGNCQLPRDQSTVIRKGTPRQIAPRTAQIPAGIVPGVSGLDTPAVVVTPSLGF